MILVACAHHYSIMHWRDVLLWYSTWLVANTYYRLENVRSPGARSEIYSNLIDCELKMSQAIATIDCEKAYEMFYIIKATDTKINSDILGEIIEML